MDFKKELTSLINKYSKENGSDTPDFILADYLAACLQAYEDAIKTRDGWFGFTPWQKLQDNKKVIDTQD